jgi:stage V sporulation protein S
MELIKVSSHSDHRLIAGAIAGMIRDGKVPEVQAIAPDAIHRAVKAIIRANGYLNPEGVGIACVPKAVGVEINGEARTAVRFVLEVRRVKVEAEPNLG